MLLLLILIIVVCVYASSRNTTGGGGESGPTVWSALRPIPYAYSITRDGKTIAEHVSENMDVGNHTDHPSFMIVSVSKVFGFMMVQRATVALGGQFTLNSLLSDYMTIGKGSDKITIHDLLYHKTDFAPDVYGGLLDAHYNGETGFTGPCTQKEVRSAIEKLDIHRTHKMNYSNVNYMILGIILEQVTGKTVPILLGELCDEIGLKHTTVGGHDNQHSGELQKMWRRQYADFDIGANVFSTVDDLVKLARSPLIDELIPKDATLYWRKMNGVMSFVADGLLASTRGISVMLIRRGSDVCVSMVRHVPLIVINSVKLGDKIEDWFIEQVR